MEKVEDLRKLEEGQEKTKTKEVESMTGNNITDLEPEHSGKPLNSSQSSRAPTFRRTIDYDGGNSFWENFNKGLKVEAKKVKREERNERKLKRKD